MDFVLFRFVRECDFRFMTSGLRATGQSSGSGRNNWFSVVREPRVTR